MAEIRSYKVGLWEEKIQVLNMNESLEQDFTLAGYAITFFSQNVSIKAAVPASSNKLL